jgi:hypothetical protein
LETFYVGNGGAEICCRIYNKGKEVQASGKKLWFLKVWGLESCENVWRVEFQLRRKALKCYGANTVSALLERLGGMWANLTDSWLSLRLPGGANVARREVHPWWQAVQQAGERLGSTVEIKRDFELRHEASVGWFTSHMAGCLMTYAALMGLGSLEEVLQGFGLHMSEHWQSRDFGDEYKARFLRLGLPPF